MQFRPEASSGSIVVLGAFNPAIFSPDWLERFGLVGVDDAQGMREAGNLVVSRQVTVVEGEAFLLQVEENKLTANCKSVLTPALRDLVMGILELVPHTPVRALGQNFDTLFRFFDKEAYHKVGDVLAPKPIWNELYPDDRAIGVDTLTMKVQEGTRDDLRSLDALNISVQHANASYPAIRVSYNDHHEVASVSGSKDESAQTAIEVLRTTWEAAWQDSQRISEKLFELALNVK